MSYVFDTISLRPLRLSDKEKTIIWRNDPLIRNLTLGHRFPVTDRMNETWFESAMTDQSKTRIVFSIDENNSGEFIGIVQLYGIDWISKRAMLGITIGDRKHQRKGYGKAAVKAILDIGKNYFNLRKVSLEVVDIEEGAFTFYQKIGFIHEGTMREHVYLYSKYVDVFLMSYFL